MNCSRRPLKNGSESRRSAPARSFTRVTKAASISWSVRALTRMQLQSERARRLLQLARPGFSIGANGIDHGDRARFRHQLVQQIQPLRCQLDLAQSHAGGITARMRKTANKAALDGIDVAPRKHDWNRRGRHLGFL